MNKLFWVNGEPAYFSPLQVSDGMCKGLKELTSEEEESYLNPSYIVTTESIKELITKKRWEVETGGITLPNGIRVATGIDDQNRITSVVANAERAGLEEVDFKSAEGWVKVTLAELQAIATAIALHVQACFSTERAHHEAIDVIARVEDEEDQKELLKNYDFSKDWPPFKPVR